jgi:hypothetical protein
MKNKLSVFSFVKKKKRNSEECDVAQHFPALLMAEQSRTLFFKLWSYVKRPIAVSLGDMEEDSQFANAKPALDISRLSQKPIESNKPSCVIYYNGTFAPVHIGHLEAMEAAKSALQVHGVSRCV